ncbi:MAG: type II toxin-antitoxin system VapC family toxin [Candidatus Hydrogenedentota bacterium]
MPVMVDSCVYLDIFTQDATWFAWSAKALADAADQGVVVMNPVIYAEISIRFERIEELEELLPQDFIEYRSIPREAAFLAGKSFVKYRRRGGHKSNPLPDFFIGAHAAVAQLSLITRDPMRFRRYFPSIALICP